MNSSVYIIVISFILSRCEPRSSRGNIDSAYTMIFIAIVEHMPAAQNNNRCLQCGAPIHQPVTGRKRRFCSDSCRWKWWHLNGDEVLRPTATRQDVTCPNCGKTFSAYRRKARKYCCHACYIRDRFWRLEDGRAPYVPPAKS